MTTSSEHTTGTSATPAQSQIDIPEPTPNELGVDKNAMNEAIAFYGNIDLSDSKQLEKLKKAIESTRSNQKAKHLHYITIAYFYMFALAGISTFAVILWHILLPDKYHFLEGEELARAAEFLAFGGAGIFMDRASRSIN